MADAKTAVEEKEAIAVRQRLQGKPTISKEELAKHQKESDCWIAIEGVVYDVTKFLPDHPGGLEVILNSGGRDASDVFDEVSHSQNARVLAQDFEIGLLEGCEKTARGAAKPFRKNQTSRTGASSDASGGFGWMPFLVVAGIAVAAYVMLGSMQQH